MTIQSICFALLTTAITATAFAQASPVNVTANVVLPVDTVVKKQLLSSLNDFLSQTGKPNRENTGVLPSELLETSVLLDEMKDLQKSNDFKDTNFYKPYLTNATQLSGGNFLIQLSWMGIYDSIPYLRAAFTLLTDKKGTRFYFHSPLKQNTVAWKIQKFGSTNVYFKTTLDEANAKKYFKKVREYDKKLSAPSQPSDLYCADNFHEVLQLIGIDYKSDFNGYAHNTETTTENNRHLNVNGELTAAFATFDPHDLWHERLHNMLSTDIINRPVDEGTAYLYGGSWGISWQQVLETFEAYASANPNADWLSLYNESINFSDKGKPPMKVDFVINALLVQKIEREKGFSSVIELLSCGNKQKGNENYFTALQKITGITRATFNGNVWKLIKAN